MDYRELGRTGLKVSSLCLGTMTFGEQNSEADGHAQMDYARERGINMFDAAEIYPVPPKPETQGRTEAIIGTWLAARGSRDKVMIATKVAGRGKMTWLRQDGAKTRHSEAQINEAVEASLRRLRTDYIDLYQLHWPDRPMRIFEGHDYLHLPGDTHPIRRDSRRLGEAGGERQGEVHRAVQRDALGSDELSQGVGAARPAAARLDSECLQPRQPLLRDRASRRSPIGSR